jgi:hypothetical protein
VLADGAEDIGQERRAVITHGAGIGRLLLAQLRDIGRVPERVIGHRGLVGAERPDDAQRHREIGVVPGDGVELADESHHGGRPQAQIQPTSERRSPRVMGATR